jgi:adrenodoxin-NADP+ reductase
LSGILSAREFVAWYNGHPYFDHIGEQVANALGSKGRKEAVVIGQGNVALDCARILAKGGRGLHDTDISSRALPVIGEEGISAVKVVGRRGHVQGAFTIKVSTILFYNFCLGHQLPTSVFPPLVYPNLKHDPSH